MNDERRTDWTWGQVVQEANAVGNDWRNALTADQVRVLGNDIKLLMKRMRDDLVRKNNDLERENIALRRDAEIDPELLTAAWLHGADHARRKARWPEPTDEAAEQLAEAIKAADYIIQPPEFYRRKAAFVLRRLREQEGEDV